MHPTCLSRCGRAGRQASWGVGEGSNPAWDDSVLLSIRTMQMATPKCMGRKGRVGRKRQVCRQVKAKGKEGHKGKGKKHQKWRDLIHHP